jgi:hypothetical protein
VAHAAPSVDPAGNAGESSAGNNSAAAQGGTGATLVLPSVPIDHLLDDHAVEFEECKRWANSDAGQAAHMTNPAGFANVRAHAEAHLRAMAQAAVPPVPPPAAAPKSGKPQPTEQ